MPDKISCIIVDDERIAREILVKHLSLIDSVNIVATCKSAAEAFNIINARKVDLIFLDINMPSVSGLSFAKSIKRDIKIIFTTAYREYAIEGFDLQAVDYLLKPVSFERLLQALNKYMDENVRQAIAEPGRGPGQRSDHFFVRSDRKMIKITFDEIRYIESIGDYVKIHLEGRTVVTRESMSGIEAKLPQSAFLRTHRSFIVSVDHIDSFTSEYIETGRTQVPVSRTYRDVVLERLAGEDNMG